MTVYYNEIDPFAAQWLRELMKAGLIAPGDVDERDIWDVAPTDLATYDQCHFFAGIGTWSYALRLAGWPDDRPVWTGSCPCQPFSQAGARKGFADERHLWPAWFWLISQSKPGIIFGEQVASKAGLAWLDLVSVDLEGAGYIIGTLDLCAASVGAPHTRQRLWFVAHNLSNGLEGQQQDRATTAAVDRSSTESAVAHANRHHRRTDSGKSNTRSDGRELTARSSADDCSNRPGPVAGFWRNAEWLLCWDGKARPIEPGISPLVDGAPAKVGRLRGYGNAIVAPLAAEFIRTYMQFRMEAS